MIIYSETKEDLINHIHSDIEEIENIRALYQNKLKVFRKYLVSLNERIQKEEKAEEISIFIEMLHLTEENLKYFSTQIKNVEEKIAVLSNLEKDIEQYRENSYKQRINEYNENYISFKKEFIEHSIAEEELTLKYIENKAFIKTMLDNSSNFKENEELNLKELNLKDINLVNTDLEEIKLKENKINDNNILLISEIQNKVILPYKASELKEILDNSKNGYSNVQAIIDEKYTLPLENYKHAYIARYKETFKLMREREKASLLDSLDLALELMKNRYVHPAIITACKNSDQLDVYLDCLETNELEDFPFFDIKYELYPVKVKIKKIDFEMQQVFSK